MSNTYVKDQPVQKLQSRHTHPKDCSTSTTKVVCMTQLHYPN